MILHTLLSYLMFVAMGDMFGYQRCSFFLILSYFYVGTRVPLVCSISYILPVRLDCPYLSDEILYKFHPFQNQHYLNVPASQVSIAQMDCSVARNLALGDPKYSHYIASLALEFFLKRCHRKHSSILLKTEVDLKTSCLK